MLYCHHTILRLRAKNGFNTVCLRLAATIVLALALPVLANGYTVVMRGGHRIDIPDRFQLTETALTYEVSPGILVSLQLSSIDIAATDVANGSPPGTLLRRSNQDSERQTQPVGKSSASRATRTFTNLDLEQTRLKRIASEAAYEIRRKELGLPSREETDRRRQEESVRARGLLARSEVETAEAESYWRTRASALRNEIFVLDSEINFLRARLAETSDSISIGSFATFGSLVPFPFIRTDVPGPSVLNQGGIVSSQSRIPTPGTVGVAPGQSNGVMRVNPTGRFSSFGYGRHSRCSFAPCAPVFSVTYPVNYNSYDRSAILGRLNELEAARSGLQARWRILEDEARRAGAQPGWLRQ